MVALPYSSGPLFAESFQSMQSVTVAVPDGAVEVVEVETEESPDPSDPTHPGGHGVVRGRGLPGLQEPSYRTDGSTSTARLLFDAPNRAPPA